VITKLVLDQTRFIVRLPDVSPQKILQGSTDDACIYKAVMEQVHASTSDLKEGATHWKAKKGAVTKSVYPLDGGSKLTVAYGWSSKAKYHFMTAQFNPSKLTTKAACEVVATFQTMFEWGYPEFIAKALCNYVEVPIDVLGGRKSDYLFFDSTLKRHDDTYEENGTLYLGAKSSSRSLCIYDKAKQIADTGGPVLSHELLRMEARLKTNVAALALHDLSCPFLTLRVVDKAKLMAIKHNSGIKLFRKRVLDDGMQPQEAFSKAVYKKGLLADLEAARPPWYEPPELWKKFPSVAHRITLDGMQSIAA